MITGLGNIGVLMMKFKDYLTKLFKKEPVETVFIEDEIYLTKSGMRTRYFGVTKTGQYAWRTVNDDTSKDTSYATGDDFVLKCWDDYSIPKVQTEL